LKANFDYKANVQYFLELADIVTIDNKRAALCGDDCGVQASTSKNIVLKMEKKMAEWNGFPWETELKLRKNGTLKKGPGVTGLSSKI